MGFAGVLAATGHMSLVGAIAVGVSGEVLGAYLAWMVGRYLGRAAVERYGKYVLLSRHDLDRTEDWYQNHEAWGVFAGRLVPLVRNFVALPAGIAEVPLVRFGVLTFLGSLIWDAAMASIGYGVGSSWHKIMHGFSDAGYVLAVVGVLVVALFFWHRLRSYRAHGYDASPNRHVSDESGAWEVHEFGSSAYEGRRLLQTKSDSIGDADAFKEYPYPSVRIIRRGPSQEPHGDS